MIQSLLLRSHQLHIKDQRSIRRNCPGKTSFTVGQLWRNAELTLAADFHSLNAFIPALDDLSVAQDELERVASAYRTVELLARRQPPCVFNFHFFAGNGKRSHAGLDVPVLQAGGSRDRRARDVDWSSTRWTSS